MPIVINLDVELAKKKMSVADFAAAIDITPANVSVLKNGRAKAVRFSTLDAICRVLECQPGDIFMWVPEDETATEAKSTLTGA
ncbi:helix-turn-helix transcriptional regulator [Cryobacterium sp. PH29-G1]|uniref:helix-turn-helix domain-containing protein n=1 Tax=Cryobacterium sp. PH29-G1 TaxID=3046211 RepID=UPI0024B932CD|nr:helix-turn-helix transcriptional regulator [Cryobacterium sp. PH29-G1]MDJ0348457.1 helix-turn-helix transcriptional regulator [Cryobacterium sp. PH29-G1]